MKRFLIHLLLLILSASVIATADSTEPAGGAEVLVPLPAGQTAPLKLSNFFYETAQGRVSLPAQMTPKAKKATRSEGQATMPDGRVVKLALETKGTSYVIRLSAQPADGIVRWGVALDSVADEYYTGLMERVVDGPQQESWNPARKEAMNLRGQKVDMILKPTTSVYAPYYLSSRGYAAFVLGDWPGKYDFAVDNPSAVQIAFEGPSFAIKIYTSADPAALVRAHALDAGLPFMPPKWTYTPWRWRDEHTHRATYYDGTPVTGPFNSEFMEDVLMMKAYGIPNGVYWIDRPWGPGRLGYDDFEIDEKRLPNFAKSVKWLNQHNAQMVLWIGPFYQGQMEKEALAKGYNLAGQPPQPNNYPMVDFSNPAAKKYWQDGVAKLLKLGVAGFKLDRAEEDIPEEGPYKIFDGRSIRENRNNYPVMYIKATYDVAKQYRPNNDFVLMPRAAYTGSSPWGVFWGGDIGGTQEGLRASIIGMQRAAVMGYPNWGADTCGYNKQLMEQEVCTRWLAFSAFNPIMEVGPTRNVAFWNLPREPKYDETLIAAWRLYARLHERLVDYSYKYGQEASKTGMPIVRPLFLVDPKAPQAWSNWWTYLYGADLLVSPVWEKGQTTQEIYLPSGASWRDAWTGKVYQGGKTIRVPAAVHQIPIFVRAGSKVQLGDLNQEWKDAVQAARQKPDLKVLEAEMKQWFENQK